MSPVSNPSETGRQRILRMSTERQAAPENAAVRSRIEGLAQAIRNKNIDELMTYYSQEVVVFDLMPPLDLRGAAAYRRNFERWFAAIDGPIDFEMKNLRVTQGAALAFCDFLSHITGKRPGGGQADYWVRVTSCFEKLDGQWLVTHEHISTPAKM